MQPLSRHLTRLALAVGVAASAAAQYSSDFEGLNASAAGTALSGQDGYYIPAVANTIDFNVHTYAGNTLNIPANPSGGAQFIGALGPGTMLARGQRDLTFSGGVWTAGYDICASFAGTLPAGNNLGSFSLQPSTTNRFFIGLAVWSDLTTATNWNANFQWADAGGVTVTDVIGDPAFQNLPINAWYRLETDFNLTTGEIVEVRITDLANGTTTANNPVGRFLIGTATALPDPTAFRFFAGGGIAGNILAFDNPEVRPVGPVTIGTTYCSPAVPNSTGASTSISATGSTSVAANDVTLAASSMPNNAFGYFITSLTQDMIPQPGNSLGVLCLGGSIGRYVGPGQVQNSGTTGGIQYTIDLTVHPTPTGFVQVQAGETWNFQCWHRDMVGGVARSNFSDAVSIAFQ